MFTLQIDDRAIAVINADEATARDLFTCDGFKDDIRSMTSAGRPIWNGTSALTVREASEDEIEEFEDALAEDDGTGDFEADPHHQAADNDAGTKDGAGDDEDEEDEDDADIVFLVEIDDEQDGHDA